MQTCGYEELYEVFEKHEISVNMADYITKYRHFLVTPEGEPLPVFFDATEANTAVTVEFMYCVLHDLGDLTDIVIESAEFIMRIVPGAQPIPASVPMNFRNGYDFMYLDLEAKHWSFVEPYGMEPVQYRLETKANTRGVPYYESCYVPPTLLSAYGNGDAAQPKPKAKPKQKFCFDYNKFGRCKSGDKCTFKHDPANLQAAAAKIQEDNAPNVDNKIADTAPPPKVNNADHTVVQMLHEGKATSTIDVDVTKYMHKGHPYAAAARQIMTDRIAADISGGCLWVIGASGQHELSLLADKTVWFCPTTRVLDTASDEKYTKTLNNLNAFALNEPPEYGCMYGHDCSIYTNGKQKIYVIDATLDMLDYDAIDDDLPSYVVAIDVLYYFNSTDRSERKIQQLRRLRYAIYRGAVLYSLHHNPLKGEVKYGDEITLNCQGMDISMSVADKVHGEATTTMYNHLVQPILLSLGSKGYAVGHTGLPIAHGNRINIYITLLANWCTTYQLLKYQATKHTLDKFDVRAQANVIGPMMLDSVAHYATPATEFNKFLLKLPKTVKYNKVFDLFAGTGRDGKAIASRYGCECESNDADPDVVDYYNLDSNIELDSVDCYVANAKENHIVYLDPPYCLWDSMRLSEIAPACMIIVKHGKDNAMPQYMQKYHEWSNNVIHAYWPGMTAKEITREKNAMSTTISAAKNKQSVSILQLRNTVAPAARAVDMCQPEDHIELQAKSVLDDQRMQDSPVNAGTLVPEIAPRTWWQYMSQQFEQTNWSTVALCATSVVIATTYSRPRPYSKTKPLSIRILTPTLQGISTISHIVSCYDRKWNNCTDAFADPEEPMVYDHNSAIDSTYRELVEVLPSGSLRVLMSFDYDVCTSIVYQVCRQLAAYAAQCMPVPFVTSMAGFITGEDITAGAIRALSACVYFAKCWQGKTNYETKYALFGVLNIVSTVWSAYRTGKSVRRVWRSITSGDSLRNVVKVVQDEAFFLLPVGISIAKTIRAPAPTFPTA